MILLALATSLAAVASQDIPPPPEGSPDAPMGIVISEPEPMTEGERRAEARMEERMQQYRAAGDTFGVVNLGKTPVELAAQCQFIANAYSEYSAELEPDAPERDLIVEGAADFAEASAPIIAPYRNSVAADEWEQLVANQDAAIGVLSMAPSPLLSLEIEADRAAFEAGERDIMRLFFGWLASECLTEDFAEREAFMLSVQADLES